MRQMNNKRAFTLVELMVVVALLAVIASVAVPSFTQFLINNRLQAQADEFAFFLQYARGEAVTKRQPHKVVSIAQSVSITDINDNVLSIFEPRVGFNFGNASFNFNALGNINSNATVFFTFCDNNNFKNGFTVRVEPNGSIQRSAKGHKDMNANTPMTTCSL